MKKRMAGLLLFLMAAVATPVLAAPQVRDLDVVSKTTIRGSVNGSTFRADVVSKFNTGRGGSSTCTFSELPGGFNPATLGTHA